MARREPIRVSECLFAAVVRSCDAANVVVEGVYRRSVERRGNSDVFRSAGGSWKVYSRSFFSRARQTIIDLGHGSYRRAVEVVRKAQWAELGGQKVAARAPPQTITFDAIAGSWCIQVYHLQIYDYDHSLTYNALL